MNMQARLGGDKMESYLVLRENRIDRIIIVFHAKLKRNQQRICQIAVRLPQIDSVRAGPPRPNSNNSTSTTSTTCLGLEYSACGLLLGASPYRGHYGISNTNPRTDVMPSVHSRPHQGDWHPRSRT